MALPLLTKRRGLEMLRLCFSLSAPPCGQK